MRHVTFIPDISPNNLSLTSARLRFPDSSHLDVTTAVHQWLQQATPTSPPIPLTIPCRRRRCCKTRLELTVRPPRSKRSAHRACSGNCCKKSLKISFKEIGWNWVIQPKEFEAFHCKGRCRDVTSDFASTHALMQSILSHKGRKVSRPCCTPKRLKPLSLLHYNDKTPPELVVTRKKGMIVKECACT